MSFLIVIEKGDNEIKENLKLYDDKDMAIKYCQEVKETIDIVNKTIDDVDDEWNVYFIEMELIYK